MQIFEIRKLNLKGSILDVGSKKSIFNVTNHLNTEEKINYADKFSKDPNDLIMDLEEVSEFKDKTFKNKYMFFCQIKLSINTDGENSMGDIINIGSLEDKPKKSNLKNLESK